MDGLSKLLINKIRDYYYVNVLPKQMDSMGKIVEIMNRVKYRKSEAKKLSYAYKFRDLVPSKITKNSDLSFLSDMVLVCFPSVISLKDIVINNDQIELILKRGLEGGGFFRDRFNLFQEAIRIIFGKKTVVRKVKKEYDYTTEGFEIQLNAW